jgi:hypothetical protein
MPAREAIKVLDCSLSTLHKLTSTRRIKFYKRKFSNRLFFKREDLDAFLQGQVLEPLKQEGRLD